jgi:hypothetical protein
MVDTVKIKSEVIELSKETRKWQMQNGEYRGMTKEIFFELMKTKYDYLYTNSSTLFDRCVMGDLNMEQFNYMLKMLDEVNAGKDYQTVSQAVGQKLVDIYVKPLIEDK